MVLSSGVISEANGRGEITGRLLFIGLTYEGCGLERVDNSGGDGCEMAWEVKSKAGGTINLFRRIPSGVMKYVDTK
jgi:hypothetical protein